MEVGGHVIDGRVYGSTFMNKGRGFSTYTLDLRDPFPSKPHGNPTRRTEVSTERSRSLSMSLTVYVRR